MFIPVDKSCYCGDTATEGQEGAAEARPRETAREVSDEFRLDQAARGLSLCWGLSLGV